MVTTYADTSGDLATVDQDITIKITALGGATSNRLVKTRLVVCKYDVVSIEAGITTTFNYSVVLNETPY